VGATAAAACAAAAVGIAGSGPMFWLWPATDAEETAETTQTSPKNEKAETPAGSCGRSVPGSAGEEEPEEEEGDGGESVDAAAAEETVLANEAKDEALSEDDGEEEQDSQEKNENDPHGSRAGSETGESDPSSPSSSRGVPTAKAEEKSDADDSCALCKSGPGKRVLVPLDPEVVDGLPLMDLEDVRRHDGRHRTADGRLLVTYEGIVFDVTQFADHHPGGRELLRTAAGLDLDHFFGDFVVHGESEKAGNWLAPLACGKLSAGDAERALELTSAEVHVDRRMALLRAARWKVLCVTATLPLWIAVRKLIRLAGFFFPPLGRALAWACPVAVPGFTRGAGRIRLVSGKEERSFSRRFLQSLLFFSGNEDRKERASVAVIGGGIAGCGAAWALAKDGFDVTLFEARSEVSGNAKTFDWDFSPFRLGQEESRQTVKSCVSVTAWPPVLYKNYTALLAELGVDTVHIPLSWFLHSKVPGAEGTLWAADPALYPGSLRTVLAKDFTAYSRAVSVARAATDFFTLSWAPWKWGDTPSMYTGHTGLGLLNPCNILPLHTVFRAFGGSEKWWDVVFTPHYTASFLVDELRPFPAVFGPIIEMQIPLLPNASNTWQGPSVRSPHDANITTCVTWKEGGKGIRRTFDLLVRDVTLREKTRVREVSVLPSGKKRVFDEFDNYVDVDRVVFACPSNAVGNIYKKHGVLEDIIFSTPVYADDHHPGSGHMHSTMHSDASVIDAEYREECLKRASNHVEVTQTPDGRINIQNDYNFGVQTPGPGVYDLPLDQKPVMLISHALGDGKSIDPSLVRGAGNHSRAHPLYSGWNVMAQLSLRLVQGKDGIYYCSNWTTPGNCHDMSLLSGLICALAIGARYPFEGNREAKKDLERLRDLMGF
jgi:cytochrome b involved in lipid metabolism